MAKRQVTIKDIARVVSVLLQVEADWTPEKYVRCHPGGKLGERKDDL